MQKIVALVTHETFTPQRAEWVGTIVKEIITLAGSAGSGPYQDNLEERNKAVDSLLSQVGQDIDKRKTVRTTSLPLLRSLLTHAGIRGRFAACAHQGRREYP